MQARSFRVEIQSKEPVGSDVVFDAVESCAAHPTGEAQPITHITVQGEGDDVTAGNALSLDHPVPATGNS